ncbi:hypothetical protein JCM11641_004361 [Rhodosporidiobolus odoratus]
MQAWVCKKKGSPKDVLRLEQNWPKPVPKDGYILVKVHCAALNPMKAGQGVLAEYTLVEKRLVDKKPDNVTFEEASTFPVVTLAVFACLKRAGLKKGAGQRVFINGGSGGLGVCGIQIARAYGAYVVATCSSSSRELVESLGPDEAIDYTTGNLMDRLAERFSVKEKPFDIVFDTNGSNPELYRQSPRYLTPTGIFIDPAGPPRHGGTGALFAAVGEMLQRYVRPTWLGGVPRQYVFGVLDENVENQKEVVELIKEGKLKAVLDAVYPFEQTLQAYERHMSGRYVSSLLSFISK